MPTAEAGGDVDDHALDPALGVDDLGLDQEVRRSLLGLRDAFQINGADPAGEGLAHLARPARRTRSCRPIAHLGHGHARAACRSSRR